MAKRNADSRSAPPAEGTRTVATLFASRLGAHSQPFLRFHAGLAESHGRSDGNIGRAYLGEIADTVIRVLDCHDLLPLHTKAHQVGGDAGLSGEVERLLSELPEVDDVGDVMQALQRACVPAAARKADGSFYTPRWLVEFTLERAGYDGNPNVRVVDPTCGSGAFLVACLSRLRAHCRAGGLSSRETLAIAQKVIVGIDRDAMALRIARANLLLNARDLIATGAAPPSFTLKLGDVVTMPDESGEEFEAPETALRFRNRSFDLVVGNPPWIGWETTVPSARRSAMASWKRYGLLAHGGMQAILGKGKKEYASLVCLAAADRLLKPNGKLALIVPKSLFKSAAAEGFRRFRFAGDKQETTIRIDGVDDFGDLRPFPDATTKTCVMTATKGSPTEYPVQYRIHQALRPIRAVAELALHEVASATRPLACSARPSRSGQSTASWVVASESCLEAIQPLWGASTLRAYEGVNTGGANGVYWVERLADLSDNTVRIRNLSDVGKTPTESLTAEVEADLLFPILRGVEAKRWRANPTAHVLLAQDVARRRGIDLPTMQRAYPKALAYLARFEQQLSERSIYRRYFARFKGDARAPFYTMFNIGSYTMAPIKVVWHRMISPPAAAVLIAAGKPVLPQETHAFVVCESDDEAHFVAGAINSSVFRIAAAICSDGGGKSFAGPHLLETIRIPDYSELEPNHRRLAELARKLTQPSPSDRANMERQLDQAAFLVWNIDETAARDIRDFGDRFFKTDLLRSRRTDDAAS